MKWQVILHSNDRWFDHVRAKTFFDKPITWVKITGLTDNRIEKPSVIWLKVKTLDKMSLQKANFTNPTLFFTWKCSKMTTTIKNIPNFSSKLSFFEHFQVKKCKNLSSSFHDPPQMDTQVPKLPRIWIQNPDSESEFRILSENALYSLFEI